MLIGVLRLIVWGNVVVSLPARSAGKNWDFYSVSGEIPARSAGKFWGTCVASVKFCSLAPRVAHGSPGHILSSSRAKSLPTFLTSGIIMVRGCAGFPRYSF